MCARISLTVTDTEIADLFGLAYDLSQPRSADSLRVNVAPSSLIPVVRVVQGRWELADLRWGFVPHWNTKPQPTGFANARAETVAEKPAFRDAFRHRRCLVPVSGFFEWMKGGRTKQPYFFRPAGGGLMVLAGIWDRWNSPSGVVETVAILTVPANDLIRPLHDRMPAILREGHFSLWLDPRERQPDKLLPLLTTYPPERLEGWPVSPRVNSVKANGLDLLTPIPPAVETFQPKLFDVA
ncbi:MAG: SOS response-associated peptidase [Gemmataceae bacterium]|nr:SOS response-associated peptidase [Gemmata sp.]MDW8197831.1 SOS response-associated peptidase [Gemmataceae bacterium]